MTFPLLPIPAPSDGASPTPSPAVLINPDQPAFSLFFNLEAETTDTPIEEVTIEVGETEPTAPDRQETEDESLLLSETEISVEPADSVGVAATLPEKPQQTLAESMFGRQKDVLAGPANTAPIAKPLVASDEKPPRSNGVPIFDRPVGKGDKVANVIAPDPMVPADTKVQKLFDQAEPSKKPEESSRLLHRHAADTPVAAGRIITQTIGSGNANTGFARANAANAIQNADAKVATVLSGQSALPTQSQNQWQYQPVAPPTPTPNMMPTLAPNMMPQAIAAARLASAAEQKVGLVDKTADVPFVQGHTEIQQNTSRSAGVETVQSQPQSQPVAKSIAQQMAVAIYQNGSGTTEIRLSPDELGRVRMVMTVQENAMTVVIHTDRPETHDLLRRHIETLTQEFKNMGYSNSSFTFAQNGNGENAQNAGDQTSAGPIPIADDNSDTTKPERRVRTAGLDLRL